GERNRAMPSSACPDRACARTGLCTSTAALCCHSCLKTLRFVRLQRDQRLLRNHAIPQFTFLTPVGNRCITPRVCVKEPSRSRGVIPTAGGLSVHKGTVFCRNIRRKIQRYWILRRICRSISCSVAETQQILTVYTYPCTVKPVKRRDLERALRQLGWQFLRHGGKHDVWTDGKREE